MRHKAAWENVAAQIEQFSERCKARERTDTSEAWVLLDWIAEIAERQVNPKKLSRAEQIGDEEMRDDAQVSRRRAQRRR